MPKLQIKATELQGTDVQFVSLVKRGANRIPFRIVKEDTEMSIDLGKIGLQLFNKTEATPPAVYAAVVRKGADLDVIKAALSKAGIDVSEAVEKGDVTVFIQKGVTDSNSKIVKLDDDVGLVVSNVSKSFSGYDWESTSFGDVLQVEGFYPSMYLAKSAFTTTVENIMRKADDPAEASDAIAKACDDFKGFLTVLTSTLPVHAFKADDELALAKAAKDKKKPQEGMGGATCEDGTDVQKANGKETIADNPEYGNDTGDLTDIKGKKNQNIDGKPVHGNATGSLADVGQKLKKEGEGDGAQATETEQAPAIDQSALLAALTATIEKSVAGLRDEVNKSIEGVRKGLTEVTAQMGQVAEQARKAEEAVTGTVLADPTEDRHHIGKSDRSSGAPPLLDTAFMKADDPVQRRRIVRRPA